MKSLKRKHPSIQQSNIAGLIGDKLCTIGTLFSDLSLVQALLFVYAGATSGKLVNQYKKIYGNDSIEALKELHIGINKILHETKRCTLVNSLWVNEDQSPLLEEYLKFVESLGTAKSVPFDNITKLVDEWVSKNTNNLIPTMGDLDSSAALIICNALHFKSNWINKFDPARTKSGPFTTIEWSNNKPIKKEIKVEYMRQTGEDQLFYKNKKYKMLGKEFENDFVAVFTLPNDDSCKAPNLSNSEFENLYSNLSETKIDILELPKFTAESEIDMLELLEKIGLDLSYGHTKISGATLFIDQIKQKCKIQVDESGAEAAVVTLISTLETCCYSEPVYVKFDRPFRYDIVHKSGVILVTGFFYG